MRQLALRSLLIAIVALPILPQLEAAPAIVLWDTGSRLTDASKVEDRNGWTAVPSDLLNLEADPPKASSDPGYYGREYVFRGDAVVENRRLAAVFGTAQGRVWLYGKDANAPLADEAKPNPTLGRPIAEIDLRQSQDRLATISQLVIVRNATDEVVLQAGFARPGAPVVSSRFSFDKTGIVEIKPSGDQTGISLRSPLEYGVVPSFIGDDLIFGAAEYTNINCLHLPLENFFLGLRQGGDIEFVLTWPRGRQQMRLQFGPEQAGSRLIESVDVDLGGQSLFLGVLSAPGLWHRETLTPAFLEKDVVIPWRPPFAARWKTQLFEADLKTTFTFHESPGQIWRGVPGSYQYPVWFKGEEVWYHLSKKVPPKGESVIYFLEGQTTPGSVTTPVDILKATLGRTFCEPLLDFVGRKLRTHHRRGGEGVRRACTCGCTEFIQAIFEAGNEVAKQEDIRGALEDMVFFVQRHLERIDEYQRFADDLLQFLHTQKSQHPELSSFLEILEPITQRIPQEHLTQKDNLKSLGHAKDLARQTLALTERKDPANLKAYMELLKAWRDMGGAQDYLLAGYHTVTRKLFQEAGYRGVCQPETVAVAQEIRGRCRQCLRNPDGYEIWADY